MGADPRFALLLAAFACACGEQRSPDTAAPGTDGGQSGTSRDAAPGDARTALATLHYDDAPFADDPSNRFVSDPAVRKLGQKLFFDRSFSGPLIEGDNDGNGGTLGLMGDPGRVSCADCHVPATAFVDTRSPHQQISLAAQWTLRRAPTLLESGGLALYDWDGRRDSIWGQAIGVMENNREFNSGRLFVAEQVFRLYRTDYEASFGAMPPLDDATRFPALTPDQAGCREVATRSGPTYPCRGKPGDGADYDGMTAAAQHDTTVVLVNTAKAMAAYVSLLRCGSSRFDEWLDGNDAALSVEEQRGAVLFAGKGKCVSCHSGSDFTDGAFHDVGLSPAPVAVAFTDTGDTGATAGIAAALADPLRTAGAFSDGDRKVLPAAVTPAMLGAFRTPTLRCIAGQPSFMHTGQLRSLDEVIAFHDRGGDPEGGYPGKSELTPLGLTDTERAELVAFVKALDGNGAPDELRGPPG